jgi:hypothetical protein
MAQWIPVRSHGRIAAVIFNLGWLPGSDKSIITAPATTVAAMRSALELLRPGGILVAVLYTGHPGGSEEAEAVRKFAAALPADQFRREEFHPCRSTGNSPSALALWKIADGSAGPTT